MTRKTDTSYFTNDDIFSIGFFMASVFPVSHFLCMNYTKIFTAHYIADFLS